MALMAQCSSGSQGFAMCRSTRSYSTHNLQHHMQPHHSNMLAGLFIPSRPALWCLLPALDPPSCCTACKAAPQQFEPHLDPAVLVSQAAAVAAGAYWWWSVVPAARRSLAKDKRKGQAKEYLESLQQDDSRRLERWFYTDWLKQLSRQQQLAQKAAAKPSVQTPSASDSAPLTNQSNHNSTESQYGGNTPASQSHDIHQSHLAQNEQPRLDMEADGEAADKQPFFFSLDNPIIATLAILLAIATISIILHGQG